MKDKFTLKCSCGEELIYCPELQDKKTKRPVFECKKHGKHTFRNKDNYGHREKK